MQIPPDILQKLDIKQLNDYQKLVLEKIEQNPNRNILLEAPTGVGKTTLFEILMLTTQKKVVYVSPLRALATQESLRLEKHDSVRVAVGDVYVDDMEQVPERIILTTYEKFDSTIRRNYPWLDEIELVLIDEIHNLRAGKRGIPIELIIQWALENNKKLVMASATIPDVSRIVEWTNAIHIPWSARTVPLFEYVRYGNELYDKDGKVYKINTDLIDFFVRKGKVVMVFTETRKNAESLALALDRKYHGKVVFFHGGLSNEERRQLFQDIQNRKYQIIVSTTALGQGVNLPFYAVIFDGIRLPIIRDGTFVGWREMDVIEYKQIAGRAGRPRFDKEGISIITANLKSDVPRLLRKYVNGDLEKLKTELRLDQFVLAWLSRHGTASFSQIVNATRLTISLKNIQEEWIKTILEEMESGKMVYSYDHENEKWYSITKYGRAIATTYISIEDAIYYSTLLDLDQEQENDTYDPLYVISEAPSVKDISRGVEVEDLLDKWIYIEEDQVLKELEQSKKFTKRDFEKLKDTATWQAFAWFRILQSMSNAKSTRKAQMRFLELQHGVPKEGLALIRLPNLGRKLVKDLLNLNITTKSELCSSLERIKKVETLQKHLWRFQRICENSTKTKISNIDEFTVE